MQRPSFNSIFRENRLYYFSFSIFLTVGLLLLLMIDKGEMVIFFSNHRTGFWNRFFRVGTKFGEEIAYLVMVIIFLFVRFRHAIAFPILGILVSLISALTKWIFHMDRPGAFFEHLGLLHTINLVDQVHLNMGPTSFPSGHTMSAFALYTFIVLCTPKKDLRAILILFIAIMVGISRVYLVQHFWQDIPAGALLGVSIASLLYLFHLSWGKTSHSWLDQKLGPIQV